jgi:periplasmic protein TonB
MHRIILILIPFFFFTHKSSSQSWGDSTIPKKITFYSVEQNAKFPGGMAAFYEFLSKNLKAPENIKLNSIHNTVRIQIWISDAGKILYAEVKKEKYQDLEKYLNLYKQAALDLVKQMPDWSPAIQNGHKVQSSVTIPIVFID